MERMRSTLCLLLTVVMALSLLAGCQNEPPVSANPSGSNTPVSTDPSESSTPNSTPELTETLQQVYDLGIADMELLGRANDVCTREEAAGMLARVHEMRYGEKSVYLRDMTDAFDEEDWTKAATRYYFAQALYFSAMEMVFDFPYENWYVWGCNCTGENDPGFAWPDAVVIGFRLDGTPGEGGVWDLCPDLQEIDTPPADNPDAKHMIDFGSSPAVNYAITAYDRRDGKKVLELDENNCFRPNETMTVEQAAEAVLRYYHSFEDEAEMMPYAATRTFDPDIITPELLAKETTLPDADCTKLPSEWRGVLIFNGRVTHGALDLYPDKHIYEHEIQTVKDAGFNFIGFAFDFSRLQGPCSEEGMLNETRLKELDQVIAWCMERDIHIDLRCAGVGGLTMETPFPEWAQWNEDAPMGTDYAPEFAALWKALAQRYADIPNCYLSFNLLIEPPVNSDDQYEAFFGPAIKAIREASPDRCVIADIHCGGLTGRSMAEMGVALSYHAYDPREFCCLTKENQDNPAYLNTVVWPFTDSNGKTYDAEAVLNSPMDHSVSANELANIAAEYNVGFMVGEWGIFGNGLTRSRYSDETIRAFITDMGDTLAEKGYGWCYGNFHYPYSLACYAPAVENAEYAQVGDYSLYVDQLMLELFQQINGVR